MVAAAVVGQGFRESLASSWIRSIPKVSVEVDDSFLFFNVKVVEAPAQEVLRGVW